MSEVRIPCHTPRPWLHAIVMGMFCMTQAACDMQMEEEEDADEDLTIVVEADRSRIVEEEKQLQKKAGAMRKERDRLAQERSSIEEKLASLSKKDRKQREKLEASAARLEKEQAGIRDKSKKMESQQNNLSKQKDELLERIRRMTSSSRGGRTIEQREAAVDALSRQLSKREASIGEREKRAKELEEKSAKTLQLANQLLASIDGMGTTKTVYVNNSGSSGSNSGGNASKGQVLKSARQVRSKMDSKGIMVEDLPPTARGLNKQINESISGKNYDNAAQQISELTRVVDSIKINKALVSAKMSRLNQAIANKKLDGKKKRRLDTLLQELSEASTDGRYDRANRIVNQIANMLKGA